MENNEKIKKQKRRNDIILISSLFALIILSLSLFFAFSKTGEKVNIYVDGELYTSSPLSVNKEIEIKGENGEYNLIVIDNESVYMKTSNCPKADGYCVGEHPKSLKGQSIYCVPHGIRISIE